jgi:hypothetical protein
MPVQPFDDALGIGGRHDALQAKLAITPPVIVGHIVPSRGRGSFVEAEVWRRERAGLA